MTSDIRGHKNDEQFGSLSRRVLTRYGQPPPADTPYTLFYHSRAVERRPLPRQSLEKRCAGNKPIRFRRCRVTFYRTSRLRSRMWGRRCPHHRSPVPRRLGCAVIFTCICPRPVPTQVPLLRQAFAATMPLSRTGILGQCLAVPLETLSSGSIHCLGRRTRSGYGTRQEYRIGRNYSVASRRSQQDARQTDSSCTHCFESSFSFGAHVELQSNTVINGSLYDSFYFVAKGRYHHLQHPSACQRATGTKTRTTFVRRQRF